MYRLVCRLRTTYARVHLIKDRLDYNKLMTHWRRQMANPKIVDKVPAMEDLEPGTYYWCSCGESKKQPFCDGAHKGTEFTPEVFKVDKKETVALCQCKHTKNPPFCDGAHRTL